MSGPNFANTLLQFNTERAPLDRPEVRQAIALAIDVNELVEVVLLGAGMPGNPGFLHPESPLASQTLTHNHDPGAAARLLDDLGFAPGQTGCGSLTASRCGTRCSRTRTTRSDCAQPS